jgi:hypothetical protein
VYSILKNKQNSEYKISGYLTIPSFCSFTIFPNFHSYKVRKARKAREAPPTQPESPRKLSEMILVVYPQKWKGIKIAFIEPCRVE